MSSHPSSAEPPFTPSQVDSKRQLDSSTSQDQPPAFEIHDLTVAYQRRPVLWNVDLKLQPGRLVGIIGPNGAGKSTLIKAALGLIPKVNGWVEAFGRPVNQVRRRIGYVPQRESVDWDFPIRVCDVALMGTYPKLGWFARPGHAEKERAARCLERVGLAGLEYRQIGELSGGQQQRVFLARALAQEADLYIMDEPMAGVDAATEKTIFELLRDLRDQGKTVVVVHHDLRSVPEIFDDVVMLNLRVVAYGPTALVFNSTNLENTYRGRLTILERLGQAVSTKQRTE